MSSYVPDLFLLLYGFVGLLGLSLSQPGRAESEIMMKVCIPKRPFRMKFIRLKKQSDFGTIHEMPPEGNNGALLGIFTGYSATTLFSASYFYLIN